MTDLNVLVVKQFIHGITITGTSQGWIEILITLGAIIVVSLLISQKRDDFLETLLGVSILLQPIGFHGTGILIPIFIILMLVSLFIKHFEAG